MAQLLGNAPIGSTVYLKENNTRKAYLVVNQGKPSDIYDESCNGTWLLRKEMIEKRLWNNTESAVLETSDIQSWLNTTMLAKYENNIQSAIKQVKIPYYANGNTGPLKTGANGLLCKVFLLSGYEIGWSKDRYGSLPEDGAKLSYFVSGDSDNARIKRIAKLNGQNEEWWLRSPVAFSGLASPAVTIVRRDGNYDSYPPNQYDWGVRPTVIMPSNFIVDDSNNVVIIPDISKITVPSLGMAEQSIPISWPSIFIPNFEVKYQIQRKINNEEWQNVGAPMSQTSYSDMAQSGWGQVQYQVAPVVESVSGAIGNYTQSSIVPILDPSVLVISGSDGNLGTLTSNVPYTVSSNTGNPISITRTVNGAQVVTSTVESGFTYDIPIADLPTGTGTIQITASVEDTIQQIQTRTRTWTYYKTPINIPSTGGIAQLTQNGQNIWPVTVPDAVEAPVYLGGNLNAALNKLGQAALYTKIGSPKYNQVTVDLSKVKVGDEVLLPYNDVMVPHIVVQIGNPDPSMYDSSCDGVWLLRKDCVAQGKWNANETNTFVGNTIMSVMQTYVENYSSEVQSVIKSIKIPYCVGGNENYTVNNLANGFLCKFFPLGCVEVGIPISGTLPTDGKVLSYFQSASQSKRQAYFNGNLSGWWTRTPDVSSGNSTVFEITTSGGTSSWNVTGNDGYRPCFIMPTTFNQTYYVDSSNNIHPAQEYTQGGSITDVFGYDVPICQYEIGSYVGTGTHGSSSPNTLSFSFEPKLLCIMGTGKSSSQTVTGIAINNSNVLAGFTISTPSGTSLPLFTTSINWSNNNVSYYSGSTAEYQFNRQGKYYYIAIG